MADALLSKEHFYVNASFTNDTSVDQEAVIHVEDTTDILNRDQDWLVHVTRFSCDSMRSLAYIPKNLDAKWEIQLFDPEDNVQATFNFTVDRDFATPRDLVASMNMDGRFVSATITGTNWSGSGTMEMYRFMIDTGGRFRLQAQPSQMVQASGYYMKYVGTQDMNGILGFEDVTTFLRFQPDVIHNFCRAIDFLQTTCAEVASAEHVWQGHYYMQINDLLITLLAGVKVRNKHTNGSIISVIPDTNESDYLDDINLEDFWAYYKGLTPASVNSHAGEALLPSNDGPVWCEFYDEASGSQHTVDTGFKVSMYHMNWADEYTANRHQATIAAGRIKLKDYNESGANADFITLPVPTFQPGAHGQFLPVKYFYSANSLPGWYMGGTAAHGQAGSMAITVAEDRRTFEIHHMLNHVQPGDDMWIVNTPWKTGALVYSSSHQVVSITRNPVYSTVVVDYGVNDLLWTSIIGKDVFFTNRRVPFQSRAQTFAAPQLITYYESNDTSVILMQGPHSAHVGDFIHFIMQDGSVVFNETAYPVVGAQVSPHPNEIVVKGRTPPGTTYRIFVYRPGGDHERWAIDAKNMKMAPTTFAYQNIATDGSTLEGSVTVNEVNYPQQHFQTYNKQLLGVQIDEFVKEVKRQHIFDNETARHTGTIREKIGPDVFEAIPDTTQIGYPHNTPSVVDFGAYQYKPSDGVANIISRWGEGSRPADIMARFPSPFFTIMQPLGDSADWATDSTSAVAKSRAFVVDNLNDRPWLRLPPTTVASDLTIISTQDGASKACAPFIIGTDHTLDAGVQYPAYVISDWKLDNNHILGQTATATHGKASVQYGQLSRSYILCRKELSSTAIEQTPVKLFGIDGDYIASNMPSQVDLLFPFRQIILTSEDLQQIPERSQDAASSQPILTSYTLSVFGKTNTDAQGQPSGGVSHPFGTIYFSETGARRYHHLMKVGGGLRSFRIQAQLTYKESTRKPEVIKLSPGGQFTAQLLFMRKEDAE